VETNVCTDTRWLVWTGVLVGLLLLGILVLFVLHKTIKLNLTEKAIQKFIVPVSESRWRHCNYKVYLFFVFL
jgi:hypothetical protein